MADGDEPPRVSETGAVPEVGAPFAHEGPIVRFLAPFLKLPIEPPKVPDGARDARVFRAAPAYLKYRYVMLVLAMLLEAHLLVVLVGGALAASWIVAAVVLFLGAIAAVGILVFFYASVRLDYDLRQYVVTDRAVRTRTGAIVVSEATITFANVQDVEISQGPLQRWFGIADVIVHTAGGSRPAKNERGGGGQHRGAFVGIDRPQEVRDFILARIRAYRDAGLGDPDDPTRGHAAGGAAPGGLAEALEEFRAAAASLRAAARARGSDAVS